MITHISKGSTIGKNLCRRLFRGTLGLIGLPIDCAFALFYHPISSYWTHSYTEYHDGTRVGTFQGFVGYIGEWTGIAVGFLVGAIIGGACFIPDVILRGLSWTYEKGATSLNEFATSLGASQYTQTFVIHEPKNFFSKTWNIFSSTLGLAIAAVPYCAARIVETFIPGLGRNLSDACWLGGSLLGGLIGAATSIPLFLVNHTAKTCVNLYASFRDKVRSVCAFIYAKTNETLFQDPNSSQPPEDVHSQKFCDKVAEYKRYSTAQIFWGARMDASAPGGAPTEEAVSCSSAPAEPSAPPPTVYYHPSSFASPPRM